MDSPCVGKVEGYRNERALRAFRLEVSNLVSSRRRFREYLGYPEPKARICSLVQIIRVEGDFIARAFIPRLQLSEAALILLFIIRICLGSCLVANGDLFSNHQRNKPVSRRKTYLEALQAKGPATISNVACRPTFICEQLVVLKDFGDGRRVEATCIICVRA